MEYNIGDKVRINQQLTFKSYDIVKSMQMCYNKIAEIIDKQYDSFNNDFVYQLKIEGSESPYNWYEYMFEPLENKIRGFEVVPEEFRKHPDVDIQLPQRNDKRSAGYDLRVPCRMVIPPHSHSELEFTDVCAYMQDDEVLKVFVRSSIGCKKGLILANGTGIIDASYYPRNIGVKFYNTTDKEVVLEENERVCQCIFEKYLTADDDDCMNENRHGGFGSSNK